MPTTRAGLGTRPLTVGAPASASITDPRQGRPPGPQQPYNGQSANGLLSGMTGRPAPGGMHSAYNAGVAPTSWKRGAGLYGGQTTGGQEAYNYAQNLASNGANTGLYNGPNTTGGQEAANYATNLSTLQSGMTNQQQYNMQNVTPFARPGYGQGQSPQTQTYRPRPQQAIDSQNAWYAQLAAQGDAQPTTPGAATPSTPTTPTQATPAPAQAPQTTIDSGQQLYSQADTAAQKAAAAAQFNNDPNFLMKQFSRPGRSNDIGTLSATIPQMSAAGAGMANATQQIPFQDTMANQGFLLNQQQAQGQEGLGLQNLLNHIQGTNDYQDTNQFNHQLQALLGLIG